MPLKGQTSLILILLTAAALIFYAITLNWGHIAQEKALLTIAADQAAALLASEAASYGEMLKQSDLKNSNELTGLSEIIMAIIGVVVAIICLIITVASYGGGAEVWLSFGAVMAYLAIIIAIVSLVLQLCVIQPGITALWNKMQKDQPIQQQFYEGGVTTAFEGAVTDQVSIGDYFDLNTNGVFGVANSLPKDSVSRFAFFYTERLRMLHQPILPQVMFFYNKLNEMMNGETCGQNAMDNQLFASFNPNPYPLNPNCPTDCISNPADPACQMKIPNGFQLNDACSADSNFGDATYSPYCDPCCQPYYGNQDSQYQPGSSSHPTPYLKIRPAFCPAPATPCDMKGCTQMTGAGFGQGVSILPPNGTTCDPYGITCALPECSVNNPYGSSYPYIYDASYQNYANGFSFLEQLGRDQQLIPPNATLPLTSVTPQGSPANGTYFPNGIYAFFWLMKHYSPQVDNLNSSSLTADQLHWCTSAVASGYSPVDLTAFPDLAQLTLSYACSGQDCCVNSLSNSATGGVAASGSTPITITPGPIVSITSPASGSSAPNANPITVTATASETDGTIVSVTFYVSGQVNGSKTIAGTMSSSNIWTATDSSPSDDTYTIYAVATDSYGVSVQSAQITVTTIG